METADDKIDRLERELRRTKQALLKTLIRLKEVETQNCMEELAAVNAEIARETERPNVHEQ